MYQSQAKTVPGNQAGAGGDHAFGLRIQALPPAATPSADLQPRFQAAAAMGFDAVLLPLPAGTATGDRAAEPGFEAALAEAAAAARAAGLLPLVDLRLDQVGDAAPLLAEQPGWFDRGPARRPGDPRQDPADRTGGRPRLQDPAVLDGYIDWWAGRLAHWLARGIGGFRCLAATRLPAAFWTRLIARVPEARFLLWAPGEPAPALAGLAGSGFAGVFSSLAWWDFSGAWFFEEEQRLAAFGPRIATLADPAAPQTEAGLLRRRVELAAELGGGLLMPVEAEATSGPMAELLRGATLRLAATPPSPAPWRVLHPGPAAIALLHEEPDGRSRLLLLNPAAHRPAQLDAAEWLPRAGGGRLGRFRDADGAALQAAVPFSLPAGAIRGFRAEPGQPILGVIAPEVSMQSPRIAIEAVSPSVEHGRFAAKRIVGDRVEVEADLICDGHGKLAGVVQWRAADETEWQESRLALVVNDRWAGRFPIERMGRHLFRVQAWYDVFATFRDELTKKHAAGLDLHLEAEEGRRLVAAAAGRDPLLVELAGRIEAADSAGRVALLLAADTADAMARADAREHAATTIDFPIDADRVAARFASWYELFPRSQSGDEHRHGTFADVIGKLPHIRDMGFDVLYFPPIHPIGRKNRKGRNNTLTPSETDPGSPYAIGAAEGGHDALHPELGTLEDFARLRDAAAAHGLELAIDFAIQCSPDHPWLQQHPGWFDWRPDGSLRYAENPPKKYEDIVNVDFYAPDARPGLWEALRDVVLFWCEQGVRTFRVDNPHTKPLPFWEWMIAEVRAQFPDALFLAEAFTKPKMMYRLGKVGFAQSYTYFTWRNAKWEIEAYLKELTAVTETGPNPVDFYRPHFFVNTPDINPVFLQTSGRPGHLIRLALAGTLSGLLGVYQGFELCEAAPVKGKEEYLDSDKYQIRVWPDRRPGDIVDELTRLNHIRRENPALQTHTGVEFLAAGSDRLLWYRKATRDKSNYILVAVSLDPFAPVEAQIEVPLWEFGLPDDGSLALEDLVEGYRFQWHGKFQTLRLEPRLPFRIWRATPVEAGR
jgi:starch synthase (maltosyl-transferring)